MWILSIFLACFTLLKDATANSTVCKEDQNYICTKFAGLTVNTFVITKDTHLCEGHCSVSTILCNDSDSNSWSEWSPASLLLSSFNFSNPNVERRHRICKENQRIIQLKNPRSFINSSENLNSLRVKRRGGWIPSKFIRGLPPKLDKIVNNELKTFNETIYAGIGSTARMSCSTQGSRAIIQAYNKSRHEWVLNNIALKIDATRMVQKGKTLEIRNINPNDQGLYTCRILFQGKNRKTVFFVALVTKKMGIPVEVLEGDTLKLICPSTPLGRLFSFSYRDWYFQGKLNVTDIPAEERGSEKFFNASSRLAGFWSCKVSDLEYKRNWWIINYHVAVKPLPPPENKFIKFVRTNVVLVVTQSFGIIGFLICVSICISSMLMIDPNKIEKEKEKKRLKEEEQRLKDMKSKSFPLIEGESQSLIAIEEEYEDDIVNEISSHRSRLKKEKMSGQIGSLSIVLEEDELDDQNDNDLSNLDEEELDIHKYQSLPLSEGGSQSVFFIEEECEDEIKSHPSLSKKEKMSGHIGSLSIVLEEDELQDQNDNDLINLDEEELDIHKYQSSPLSEEGGQSFFIIEEECEDEINNYPSHLKKEKMSGHIGSHSIVLEEDELDDQNYNDLSNLDEEELDIHEYKSFPLSEGGSQSYIIIEEECEDEISSHISLLKNKRK